MIVADFGPEPMIRLRTPGECRPAKISVIRTAVAGVIEAGLKTTVLPATRKVQFSRRELLQEVPGRLQATTPSGCLMCKRSLLATRKDGFAVETSRFAGTKLATLIDLCNSPRDWHLLSLFAGQDQAVVLMLLHQASGFATIRPRVGRLAPPLNASAAVPRPARPSLVA